MSIEQLKARQKQDAERLREQMWKDWMEVVRDKLKWVAARFGIKQTDDAKVKSHRMR